jgi:hypothetical protein
VGFSPKDVGSFPEAKVVQVTDTHVARNLIETGFPVGPGRNLKAALADCFAALARRERALPRDVRADRPRHWTLRRVEAIWGREARRIDHYEIQDLTAVAVEEARHERQRLQAREERLAAFISAHRSGDRQRMDQLLGRVAGGLDHAGTRGTEADEEHDQSRTWG